MVIDFMVISHNKISFHRISNHSGMSLLSAAVIHLIRNESELHSGLQLRLKPEITLITCLFRNNHSIN